jgi:hypothetical protein
MFSHLLEVTGSGSKPAESLLHLFRVKRHDRSAVMVKDTMSILLLYLWGLLGLAPLLSCHPVQGRELQSNNTLYVPGLFDLSTFDFGEEISAS